MDRAEGGMDYCGLPFPCISCPATDVGSIYLIWNDIDVWDNVSAFIRLPTLFLFTDFPFENGLDTLPWTSFVSIRVTRRRISNLSTDSTCGVWDRGWTTFLLYGGPFIYRCIRMTVSVFGTVERNFLFTFCLYPCPSYNKWRHISERLFMWGLEHAALLFPTGDSTCFFLSLWRHNHH